MRIEILYAPECPNVNGVRRLLLECLAELGLKQDVIEREGEYPSPTIVVDGADVVDLRDRADAASCRLDLPTREGVMAALTRSRTPVRTSDGIWRSVAIKEACNA